MAKKKEQQEETPLPVVDLSAPLKDVEEMFSKKPDLTPDEWQVVDKAAPWLRATLRPEVRTELEIEYIEKQTAYVEQLQAKNREDIKKMMEQWKEEQKPLDSKDLQTLLSQEYITFKVPLTYRGLSKPKEFTLMELPQEVELKFVRSAQANLIPIVEKMNAMQWTVTSNWAEMLQKTLDSLPEALEIASDLVAICLNPYEEDKDIDGAWVRKNIATHRIIKILIAQSEVNKYRDFFSNDFQLFRTLKRT